MRNLLLHIFSLLIISLVACQVDDVVNGDDQISLTLKLATEQATRGNVTDYPSNTDSWSQAERAVDGRYIYSLSVYIIDSQKRIVACKENIAVDNQATEVVVEFDKSYNLKRGVHTLMAVANNCDHTIGGTTYESGISGQWAADSYDNLMNNKIASNVEFVSPKDVIQPLSMMKEFEMHTGSNFVEGELVRTFARLRIEVKNNSGSAPLKINNLTFSTNFAQKNAYVFDDGSDRKYFTPTGSIVASSVKALTPFVYDDGAKFKAIEPQTSAVVFDGYQLESKVTANGAFTYTLDMSYDNATVETGGFKRESSTAISKVNKLDVGNESYYLIYNLSNKCYLSANESSVVTATINDFNSIAARNIWQITKNGNSYYFKNVETDTYIQAPSSSAASLGSSQSAFTLSNSSNSETITIYSSSNWRYLGVDGTSVKGYYSSGNAIGFQFYKVVKSAGGSTSTGSIKYDIPITLTSIDPVSQQSSKVTAIKRNDFINVLVTVSYNPASGEFDFKVEDWEIGGGQVEFD